MSDIITYNKSDSLPSIPLWWLGENNLTYDFTVGWTFSLTITDGTSTVLSKTTGIDGAAGGNEFGEGVPNVVVNWSATDFDAVPAPALYVLTITATRTVDSKTMSLNFPFHLYGVPTGQTWNYVSPATSQKDAVRFLCGDTNMNQQLLSDQEVEWLISEYGSGLSAAAQACLAIAAQYAKCIDRSVGALQRSYSQKYQHYMELADRLEQQAASRSGARPFLSNRGREGANNDDGYRKFALGMHDHPGTRTSTVGDSDLYENDLIDGV